MSLGLRFCVSRKVGTGGGGWVHPKGMAVSGLTYRKALVDNPSHLVGHPFLPFMAHFSATPGWHFPRALIESSLTGGCG